MLLPFGVFFARGLIISIQVSFIKHAKTYASFRDAKKTERDPVLTLERLCLEEKLINNDDTNWEEIEAQKRRLLTLPEGIREGFIEAFALRLKG